MKPQEVRFDLAHIRKINMDFEYQSIKKKEYLNPMGNLENQSQLLNDRSQILLSQQDKDVLEMLDKYDSQTDEQKEIDRFQQNSFTNQQKTPIIKSDYLSNSYYNTYQNNLGATMNNRMRMTGSAEGQDQAVEIERVETDKQIIALEYQIKQVENQRNYLTDLKRCIEEEEQDKPYFMRNNTDLIEIDKQLFRIEKEIFKSKRLLQQMYRDYEKSKLMPSISTYLRDCLTRQ